MATKRRNPPDSHEATSDPLYDVTEAAERAGVHEQTLRHYERLGLVVPARKGASPRSPRLYSDQDIARVEHIRRLVADLGVNLAGVETILHMRDRMDQMRREFDAETRRLRQIIEQLERGP
jgi:MerR family transcriptional regulator/heat shock protein HspR